jgi:formylglycine-generating enzyme required for sulfatase activity
VVDRAVEGPLKSDDAVEPDPSWGRSRSVVAAVLAVVAIAGVALLAWHHGRPPQHCAPGMQAFGARCCGTDQQLQDGRCIGRPSRCAAGMLVTPEGCRPERRILPVAAGTLVLGPFDWEAAERIVARQAAIAAFLLDSHEVTEGDYAACVAAARCAPAESSGEPGRAQVGVTAFEAQRYCAFRDGRLPTSDELAFAAMGPAGRRYPWGDTGAVCRRAAFGLARGPCARDGVGPELAGSHPDGKTVDGIHDLAGNAAEWTAPTGDESAVRGGSWFDASATDLRSWSFTTVTAHRRSKNIGFRCAYDAGGTSAASNAPP